MRRLGGRSWKEASEDEDEFEELVERGPVKREVGVKREKVGDGKAKKKSRFFKDEEEEEEVVWVSD